MQSLHTTESMLNKSRINNTDTTKNSRWSARSQSAVPSKCKSVVLQLCISTRQC